MYYNECPVCGAALDPGERCEYCLEKQEAKENAEKQLENSIKLGNDGQYQLTFYK